MPGAPKNGHISDIGSSSARVHWNVPSDDGGSAITGYVVEKREESRRAFHRVTEVCCFTIIVIKSLFITTIVIIVQVSSEETDYYMDDLKMNTSYMVRIAAVNKYGVGEYLEYTSFQTCLPFEAPSVTHPPIIRNVTDQVRRQTFVLQIFFVVMNITSYCIIGKSFFNM